MPPRLCHALKLPRSASQHLVRIQRLSRASSTSTTPPAPSAPPTPTPTRRPLRPTPRFLLYATLGLLLGSTLGSLISQTIAAPAHPVPGSNSDNLLVRDLERQIDETFKVKVLRGKCTAAGAGLRGEAPVWRELGVLRADSRHAKSTGFVDEAMAGARGLGGVERVFWNARDKELVAVVWFGGALTGWPSVVHGGCIATMLADKSALAARLLGDGADDGAPDTSAGAVAPEPTLLDLTYKKPTYASAFYVVRVVPRFAPSEGLGTVIKSLGREVEVQGKLETLDGKVCVETKAVVPVAHGIAAGLDTAKSTVKTGSWTSWVGQG